MSLTKSFAQRFNDYLERHNSERIISGASAVVTFAIVIALVVYAIFSWADVTQLGLSRRDQVLHIALPLLGAVALAVTSARDLLAAIAASEASDEQGDEKN